MCSVYVRYGGHQVLVALGSARIAEKYFNRRQVMPRLHERCIPLTAISARQSRAVQRHLPLVHLTVRRLRGLAMPDRPCREYVELVQEGSLALLEAVRSHDPVRHGDFAAFAMARIHHAVSRYAQEQGCLIRVPFITQRRTRARALALSGDRHNPDPWPRVSQVRDGQRADPRHDPDGGGVATERTTIGDLVRRLYDDASRIVVRQMKQCRRYLPTTRRAIDLCHRERWSIPEPQSRMPLRRIAREMGCALGTVVKCEDGFRRRLATMLEADGAYRALVRLGRERPDGWRHALTDEETRELEAVERLGEGRQAASGSRGLAEAATCRARPKRPARTGFAAGW